MKKIKLTNLAFFIFAITNVSIAQQTEPAGGELIISVEDSSSDSKTKKEVDSTKKVDR